MTEQKGTWKSWAVTVSEHLGSALMSGVWLDKELKAKTGFPLLSMAYSTTVPTGKPAQAPKDPIVESMPVLHEKRLHSKYRHEHNAGCLRAVPARSDCLWKLMYLPLSRSSLASSAWDSREASF